MSMTYGTVNTRFDVEAMPDYEGISQRFREGFPHFAAEKMNRAVRDELPYELDNSPLASSEAFLNDVAERVDEEALLEKRAIFLTVKPEALV